MPSVSGDGMAFVIASSCSTPNATNPAAVVGTWMTSSSGSGSVITLTWAVSGSTPAGVYRLCSRWTQSSPYVDAGGLNVMSVSAVSPIVIGVGSVASTVTLNGDGLVDMSADAGAFVISSSGCTGTPTSVVVSVQSTYVSSSSVVLVVNDSGVAAGAYSLCVRTSSESAYFWSGLVVTIGLCVCFFACLIVGSVASFLSCFFLEYC